MKRKLLCTLLTISTVATCPTLAVSCNKSNQITTQSFVAKNVGTKATYHFSFSGELPDDNILNVSIFKPDSTITPDNLQLLQSKIDLSKGRDFDIDIELTDEFYRTTFFLFDLYFEWSSNGKQILQNFDQSFIVDYRVAIRHNISALSNLIQPENEIGNVLNFNFSISGDFQPEQIYARIIHDDSEDPKITFDGTEKPTSDYIVQPNNNIFTLPIKRYKEEIYSFVNFGIEFRYMDSDGKLLVAERINNFGILPALMLVNIHFDSEQKEMTVGKDNFTNIKFNWNNDILPQDSKVTIMIDGDDSVCFDDGKTTKEISTTDKSEKEISIGFKNIPSRNAMFNLKFIYSLSTIIFSEGVLVTLCPFGNFIEMQKTTYNSDSNDLAELEFDWVSSTLPDDNVVHATIGTDEISFINDKGEFVRETDIAITSGPISTIKSKISFTNRQFYNPPTSFDLTFSYKVNRFEVEQKFSVLLNPFVIEKWFSLTKFTKFNESDHTEQTTITWLPSLKILKDNQVKAAIVNGNANLVCFDNGQTEKTFDIDSQTKKATILFKNECVFQNKIETQIKLDFSIPTSDGYKAITQYIDYDFEPLPIFSSQEPVYFDKNEEYNYGDIYFHWTSESKPTNQMIWSLPEDSNFSFSNDDDVKTITIPFVDGKELYSAPIYWTSKEVEFKQCTLALKVSFDLNNTQIYRKVQLSIVDVRKNGILESPLHWATSPTVHYKDRNNEVSHNFEWPVSILPDKNTCLTFSIKFDGFVQEDSTNTMPSFIESTKTFTPTKKGDIWKISVKPGFYFYHWKTQYADIWYHTAQHQASIKYIYHGQTFTMSTIWPIEYNSEDAHPNQ